MVGQVTEVIEEAAAGFGKVLAEDGYSYLGEGGGWEGRTHGPEYYSSPDARGSALYLTSASQGSQKGPQRGRHCPHQAPEVLRVWSWDSSTRNSQTLPRYANSQAPPSSTEPEPLGVGPTDVCFTTTSGDVC